MRLSNKGGGAPGFGGSINMGAGAPKLQMAPVSEPGLFRHGRPSGDSDTEAEVRLDLDQLFALRVLSGPSQDSRELGRLMMAITPS